MLGTLGFGLTRVWPSVSRLRPFFHTARTGCPWWDRRGSPRESKTAARNGNQWRSSEPEKTENPEEKTGSLVEQPVTPGDKDGSRTQNLTHPSPVGPDKEKRSYEVSVNGIAPQ